MSGTGTGSGTGAGGAGGENPSGTGGAGSGGGQGGGFTAITIDSQAALDAFLANPEVTTSFLAPRLDRKAQAVRKEIAESFGVSPEQLDGHIASLKKLAKDSETDAQRREREAREAAITETRTSVAGEYDTKLGAAKAQLVKAAVIAEAQKLGFRHPEDVWTMLRDDATLTISDEFVVAGVDKAVKKVSTDRPEWVGEATFRGSPPAGNTGRLPVAGADQLDALGQHQADRRGRLSGGARTRL